MADDFGGGDGAYAAAFGQGFVLGEAVEESGGEQVACASRVDDFCNGVRRDLKGFVACGDHRALRAACDDGEGGMLT